MIAAILMLSAFMPMTAAELRPTGTDRLEKQLFEGSPEEQRTALDFVIGHTGTTPSHLMFLAAAVALQLDRLEDSGFLFYAAQLRSRFDQERFPPIDKGGDAPQVALAALNFQIGAAINPALMGVPKSFRAVVDRLRPWDVHGASNYDPGWKYANPKPAAEAHALGEKMKQESLESAEGIATLLNTPEYFKAFKTVQDYNLGSPEEPERPETVAKVENARKQLREIEERMGIPGLFYRKPGVAAAPAAGEPSAPAPPTPVAQGGASADPEAPRRTGGAIGAPTLLRTVDPKLPARLPADAPATVIVELTVTRQGKVADVRVLRGHPAIDRAVIEAARQWIYKPAMENGVPVAVLHVETVKVR